VEQITKEELTQAQLDDLRHAVEARAVGRIAVVGEDEALIASQLGAEVSSHGSHEEILAQAALSGVAALIPVQRNGVMVPHDGSPSRHTMLSIYESRSRTLKTVRLTGENGTDLLALVQGPRI